MIPGNIGILDSNGLSRGEESAKGIECNEQRALYGAGHLKRLEDEGYNVIDEGTLIEDLLEMRIFLV